MVVREFINLIGFKVNEQQLKQSERSVQKVANKMQSIGTRMTAFFTLPFAALGVGIAKTISEFEQLDVAFQTIIGDTDKANKLLDELLTLAAKTPFGVTEITKNAKQLLAVGIEYDKIIDTLIDLGNVSAGLSVPLERIALNFGQIKTQGKLTGRELRDFNVAGVPLVAELAKQFNITEKEVAKLVSSGKVGFSDVEKAFRSMARTGGKFANLMIKQSATLGGLWSNFKDLLVLSARSMSGILLPVFKKFVLLMIDLVAAFEKINPKIKSMLLFLGFATAAIGPLALAMSALASLISFTGVTFIALAGPIIAIIGWIGLLADDLITFVMGGRSLIGTFLPPWEILSKRIGIFFKSTTNLFGKFIKSIKEVGKALDLIFKGITYDDDELIEIGLKQLRDRIAKSVEIMIDLIVGLMRKLLPKLFELFGEFNEQFGKVGEAIGEAIVNGILDAIAKKLKSKLAPIGSFLFPEAAALLERRKTGEKSPGGLPGVLKKLFPGADELLRKRNDPSNLTGLGIAGAGGSNRGNTLNTTINNEIVVPAGTTEQQKTEIKKQVDSIFGNSVKQLQLIGASNQ